MPVTRYLSRTGVLAMSVALSSCATRTVSDWVLFSPPPLGDQLAEAVAPQLVAIQAEIDAKTAAGEPLGEDLEERAEALDLFGPERGHEGKAGVLFGYLLDAPTDTTFTINVGGDDGPWSITEDEHIPSITMRGELVAPYGPIRTTYTEATDPQSSPRPLLVHCYGNGANLYNTAAFTAADLLPFGDVFQFEYPGFGAASREEGEPARKISNFEPMNDAVAAHIGEVAGDRPVVLWGHSLGGLVCADLAARMDRVDGLILETTGPDAETIARSVVPRFASLFVRLKIDPMLAQYDAAEILSDFSAPILVLGAKEDGTLPVRLARTLHTELEEVGRDADYVEFPDANHLTVRAQPEFPGVISGFMAQLVSPDPSAD